ncbi:MAG: ABC transporter permease [Lewinellaceae bacterium]|nr:ABC transporter permease [Saprospiraceae bacterium]MCB9340487.1 ABC transporter permease [Lewinellaceae bacterium]
MLSNYLKIAIRNLWKQKGFTFINLTGMAVGMACCFLLLVYVNHEMHYDEFYPNLDRLYRVSYFPGVSEGMELVQVPAPMAPAMKEEMPQIEQIARMYRRGISVRKVGGDKSFELDRAHFVDSTVQEVFGMEYLQGDPGSALRSPFSVVLTDKTASMLFGKENPMGGQLMLASGGPFTVTGVVKAFPENAHLHFDLLVPFQNMADVEPPFAKASIDYVLNNNWVASHSMTYVLLKPGADPKDVDAAFPDFIKRHGHKEMAEKQRFTLFPVKDIHLKSTSMGEVEPQANPVYLRLFLGIGFLILLIACINFINLSTASYLTRMKEVGVRKVLGAARRGLIGQFLGETLMLSFGAFLIALGLLDLLIPHLGFLVNKQLSFSLVKQWPLSLGFVAVFLLAGVLAGTYPAFFASRFDPVEIFQSKIRKAGSGGNWLRKSLITVQFAVGILLISGTFIILSQLNFWRSQPLGFDKEQVLLVPLQSPNMNSLFAPADSTLRARMNSFEEKLLQNPNIEAVTLGSAMPGMGRVYHPVTTDVITKEDNLFLPSAAVDYNYVETFKLEMVAGRDFDKSFGTDHLDAYVVNESAVRALRFDSPEDALGKKLTKGGKTGKIIGVVKDYSTAGLQMAMEPMLLDVSPGTFNTFAIRLKNGDLPATLRYVEATWQDYFPAKAFEHSFMDDDLNNAYEEEGRLASLGSHFAGIAIFLSCFGLFGLISLTVQHRAKEIGIRKVLGATVGGIVALLSKDFLLLVVIAFLIAAPLAWYIMNQWLADFAYHIDLQWWHFAVAGLAAVLVAFLTMSFQSVKAALANPIRSLRSE